MITYVFNTKLFSNGKRASGWFQDGRGFYRGDSTFHGFLNSKKQVIKQLILANHMQRRISYDSIYELQKAKNLC